MSRRPLVTAAEPRVGNKKGPISGPFVEADAGTRTPDPFITSRPLRPFFPCFWASMVGSDALTWGQIGGVRDKVRDKVVRTDSPQRGPRAMRLHARRDTFGTLTIQRASILQVDHWLGMSTSRQRISTVVTAGYATTTRLAQSTMRRSPTSPSSSAGAVAMGSEWPRAHCASPFPRPRSTALATSYVAAVQAVLWGA